MVIDKFTKVLLLAVVILLSIVVLKPIFEPNDSYAAKKIEYKVIRDLPSAGEVLNTEEFFKGTERGLNKYGVEGWELVDYSNSGWAILIRR